MRIMLFVLSALFVTSALAVTSKAHVKMLGDHHYREGSPVLLQEIDTECYFMGVSEKARIFIIGKSCVGNSDVDTVSVSASIPVKYPLIYGTKYSFDYDSLIKR